jgi:hypothetical protein
MWEDPIVRDTRKRREEYAAKFNHDADAIFEDIQSWQKKRGATADVARATRPWNGQRSPKHRGVRESRSR